MNSTLILNRKIAPLALALALALSLLTACEKPNPTPNVKADDSGTDSVDSTPEPVPWCEAEGLTARSWDPSGTTGDFDTVAPDFSLELLDGTTWTYSTAFTGCDSVILVVDRPDLSVPYPDFGKTADVKEWLAASPRNVHWVFMSDQGGAQKRADALTTLSEKIAEALDRLGDDAVTAWAAEHVHFATASTTRTDTWIDTLFTTYGNSGLPLNFAIDRFQKVRELGYLADPITGWNSAPPVFLDYEAQYYNMESDRQDRLDAEDATVLSVFVESGERAATVSFPESTIMAGFDTMELDMTFICNGHPDATGCGEWDYLAYAYLCDNDDASTTDVDESGQCTEMGRFITAYARPGRWVVDATPFLSKLQDGGDHVIRVDSANAPLISLDVRLTNQGKGYRPVAMEYLWSGGGFNSDYNTGREDIAFNPPAGTQRVALWTLVTGHGYGQDRENCAEFCNHQHEFTVNAAQSYLEEFTMAGTDYGCAEQVSEGTVPNQYGTWVLGRGGWCPGRAVDPWEADITDAVDIGASNSMQYRGLFEGDTYVPVPYNSGQGFGATIVANTWMVYYE